MLDYEYLIESSDEDVSKGEITAEVDKEDFLKNIDESLVSIVKIESKRFINNAIEEDNEELSNSWVGGNSNRSTDDLIEEEEEVLAEREVEIYFQETVDAEEIETTLVTEDDMTVQDYTLVYDCGYTEINSSNEAENNNKITSRSLAKGVVAICHECGSTFKQKSYLKRHIQRKHQKEEYKLQCDICGAKFLLNFDLRRHMIKHIAARNYACDQCDQKFKTELTLKSHVKNVHNSEKRQTKNFQCNVCDRSYFHQRHLEYHVRTHTGDSRYKCEVCEPEKLFFNSDAIKWHRIRHHDKPAPFSCKICDKKFIHEKTFKSHERDHHTKSGSLAVSCPICRKSVAEKRHLKRHMRMHGNKEFVCRCGEAFKERFQLTK